MAAPPLRTEISDVYPLPSDATARLGFGKLWDYVTGLLGATGNTPEARAALGVAPRAARIDVASVAGAVDLTTAAPNTDDIRITGALAITAFTVAVGRVIRVTASGAHTLTNNASIVTQRGVNIVCAAGDTYTLRATAANTVEVLNFTRAHDPLGVDQTWQDVSGSRAFATTYYNITGKPITVVVTVSSGSAINFSVTVGSYSLVGPSLNTSGRLPFTFIVPPGQGYSAASLGSLVGWEELR